MKIIILSASGSEKFNRNRKFLLNHIQRRIFQFLIIALFLMTYASSYSAITSTGKEFWLCFMQNFEEVNRTYNLNIFISSDIAASGTVSIPGQGWSTPFSVTANGTTVIPIPTNFGHVVESDAVSNRGIHVVSDNEINVFAMNYSKETTDGSLILPVPALGFDYYTLCYNPLQRSEFAITAIEDGTQVRIIPSAITTGGHAAGTAYDVNLSKGQVYQVQSTGDLTGSRVISIGPRKQIAVFSGATCVNIPSGVPSCDHLFEQMFPNNTLRRNFVTIPLKTRLKGDTYRILAIKNGTTVTFDGGSPVSLNAGEFHETIILGATYISSNYPISVAQYSNGNTFDGVLASDPFFMMLSPLEQTREDITFEVYKLPTITGNYVNIAAKTSCVSQIRIDGTPIGGWNTVVGKPEYSWVQLNVTQGVHRIQSVQDCGFNAYVYGYGSYDSYGYSAGVQLDTLAITLKGTVGCTGSNSEFSVLSYPYPIVSYNWNFGDGGTSSQEKPIHVYQSGGKFNVRLIVTYDNSERDTVTSEFTIIQAKAEAAFTGGMCVNDIISFNNTSSTVGGGTITKNYWEFGDGSNSNTFNATHAYASAGTYEAILTITTDNGCIGRDTLSVKINPLPQPVITALGPTTFCSCDSLKLDAGDLGYTSYLWSTGASSRMIVVRNPGNYTVEVTDTNNCVGTSKAISITVVYPSSDISLPQVPLSAAPGEIIRIPVYISDSKSLDFCNMRNYRTAIEYNKTLLDPINSTPEGAMSGTSRIIDFTGVRGTSDTLIILEFMTTLGAAENTLISFNTFEWTDCPVPDSTRTHSTQFALNDLCREGGPARLYNYEGVPINLSFTPNPIAENGTINFDLPESGTTKLCIYDMLGRVVLEIHNGFAAKGQYKSEFSTVNIPTGIYYLVLKTETKVITKTMGVQK